MEMRKNIVLVDDHILVRNGLKELIEKLGPYTICGQYDNGRHFLDEMDRRPDPDLVIMDLDMPAMNGMETAAYLKSIGYKVPVLVLTLNSEEDTILQLFRSGVCGFLKKDCSSETMKNALENIFSYGYYHNEFLAHYLRNSDKKTRRNLRTEILEQLSPREKEFLRLVCDEKEYTYEQIASEMNVQHRTVDGYRESVFGKFGIKSKTGLVLFVLKHRLLDDLD